ncbi:MAG: GNAT family N-acetyltransferase [Polyangiaceae bacterium]|nr:GNAT family N-acetyltransferase [Polyangiaceae bacterium]
MQSLALELPKTLGATSLRVLRPTDLANFASYRADPNLAEYQSWEPINTAAAESFLTETASATHFIPGGWIQLAVADSTLDELLGDVGLFLSQDCTYAELGFTLARQSHGQGHATRAAHLAIEQVFRLPTVLEVRAVTDQLNHASVAVLRRVGFVQTASQDALFKGKPCVELLFARSRGDA